MSASTLSVAKKLQLALLARGEKILIVNNQFYSEQMQRPINVYCVRKAIYNETTHKTQSVELFSSTSRVHITLFLRDYWYEVNGWEVPHDNVEWEIDKAKHMASSSYEKSML